MSRRLIVISHSREDFEYQHELRNLLKDFFPRVEVESLLLSRPDFTWNETVTLFKKLDKVAVYILIVTNNQLDEFWTGLEIGYLLNNSEKHKIRCLYCPGLAPPSPLDIYQATMLADADKMSKFLMETATLLDFEISTIDDEMLREIAEEAPKLITAPARSHQYDRWQHHLWESRWAEESIFVQGREYRIWTCLDDLSFQIVRIFRESLGYIDPCWAKGLNTDGGNGFFRYSVNLNISGMTIQQVEFYAWDNSTYFAPVPDKCFEIDELGSRSEPFYCYNFDSLKFSVGHLIGRYPHMGSISIFAQQQNIRLAHIENTDASHNLNDSTNAE